MLKWVKRLAIGLVAAFLGLNFALAGMLFWLGGSVPVTEGTKQLPGLDAPAEIIRDDAGVPVIRATSGGDAYFALGFVHAQDRLWQMETMRRIGAGRMSEMFGNLSEALGRQALPFDRFTRGLGFYRRAQAAYERASPALRDVLERYAAGVNAYLETRDGPLPPEFVLLFHEPEPWHPADSLVWQHLMAFRLGDNWASELDRLRMLEAGLTAEQVAFLYSPADGSKDGPESGKTAPAGGGVRQGSPAPDMLERAARFAASLPALLTPEGASNAWALAGSRTASGLPLLANDPHLGLGNPNFWYLARMETPGSLRVGATVPGVPFLVLGHNGRTAWGFTTPHADTQDLYIETVDPADPARYLTPEGSRPFRTWQEEFHIAGKTVQETFRATRNGPVISDIWADAGRQDGDSVIALAAPSLRAGDDTAEAFLRLNGAGTVPEALDILAGFASPLQHITLADGDGNIALTLAGRVPAREGGSGFLPTDGKSSDGWNGWIDSARLPTILNPGDGFVIQANNRPSGPVQGLGFGHEFDAPFRADRTGEVLEAMPIAAATAEMQARLQMDAVSLAAASVLSVLLPRLEAEAETLTAPEREALEMLRAWDGAMLRDRPEPLLYTFWTSLLHQRLFADDLGHLLAEYRRVRPHILAAVLKGAPEWCDDIRSPVVEPCAAAIRDSFTEAVIRLTAKYGADPANWHWGQSHKARFEHLLWSRIPVLGPLLSASPATDGGDYTVNRGSSRVRISEEDFSFAHTHGAGIRAVYDFADLDGSLFSVALGQSGNPFSEHYQDLAAPWADGLYRTLGPPPPGTGRTLTLKPQ